MVRLELARLLVDERADEHVVTLREVGGPRTLSIQVGAFEAAALDEALGEGLSARPLTHELILAACTQLGGELRYVVIDDLIDDVYHAKLVLQRGGQDVTVDARPSDAIALAVRAEVDIFASDRVLRLAAD
ncbi:MAG: bifunctional nuclease family protein [Planctomycetota bacterium]